MQQVILKIKDIQTHHVPALHSVQLTQSQNRELDDLSLAGFKHSINNDKNVKLCSYVSNHETRKLVYINL